MLMLKMPRSRCRVFHQRDSKLNKTMKLVTPMTSTNSSFRKDGDFQSIQEVLINVSRVINSIVLIA